MDYTTFFSYLLVMVLVTYLLRMLPFVLVRKKFKNHYVKSFFDYIPYACLSAMTFPSILFSTGNIMTATIGLFVALLLANKGKSLLVVALAACGAVLISGLIFALF